MEVLLSVVSGLVASVLALIGILRFYLPKQSNNFSNHLSELLSAMKGHEQATEYRHKELHATLDRIEKAVRETK